MEKMKWKECDFFQQQIYNLGTFLSYLGFTYIFVSLLYVARKTLEGSFFTGSPWELLYPLSSFVGILIYFIGADIKNAARAKASQSNLASIVSIFICISLVLLIFFKWMI